MKRALIALLIVLTLVVAVFAGGFVFDAYFIAPGPDAKDVTFVIEPGFGPAVVAKKLEADQIVKSAFPFRLFVKLVGASANIQAGTFELKTGMSYAALVDTFTRANANEVEVTIPEGYTLKQIGDTVRFAIPTITEADWNATVGPESSLESHPFVVLAEKPDSLDLEGYLFPDTYRFFADATAEVVVKKMIDTMQTKYGETGEMLPHTILTLASIVEREVREPEEMGNIADIFWKRLEAGMPLQADSTINYVIGGKDAAVTAEALKTDSPYNTYQHVGLPPGPISNPGVNAIEAVKHPTANNWYYFLTSPEGAVYYGSTYEEHLANKSKYLR